MKGTYWKSGNEIVRLIGIAAVNRISETERQVLWQCEAMQGEQLQESEQAGEIVQRWEHRLGKRVEQVDVDFGADGYTRIFD